MDEIQKFADDLKSYIEEIEQNDREIQTIIVNLRNNFAGNLATQFEEEFHSDIHRRAIPITDKLHHMHIGLVNYIESVRNLDNFNGI